jgi:AraC family transcriptional regulator
MAGQSILPVDDRRFYEAPGASYNRTLCLQRSSGNVNSVNCEIKPPVDQTETRARSPLLAIALGPTRIVLSSLSSSWHGILLERHLYTPGERTSASIDKHVISTSHGSPCRFEHRNLSGEFVAASIGPRAIMLTPAGLVPDLRLHRSAELTHCALEDEFIRGVADELDHPATNAIFRAAIEDRSIPRILGMLTDELEAERPLGRLYVDSLAHALAARYLLLDVGSAARSKPRVTGLVPRILNRVRAKIEANLEADLSLESLAEESGYSRTHFLRMFRAATGVTPHQYVLNLRLRRAQDCLRHAKSSIIDIALSCGFSSQSHMTNVFRQRLETTPAEFRRSA